MRSISNRIRRLERAFVPLVLEEGDSVAEITPGSLSPPFRSVRLGPCGPATANLDAF
jgi:hypothetical protein